MAERSVDFKITAEDAASRVIDGITGKLKGLETNLTKLQAAAGAVVGSVFLTQLYQSTVQAERAQARLAAVLQSTAYAAGLSATEVKALADGLSDATAFDDDEILAGINVLLQFRSVTGDTFKEAASLATDLAVAMDTDLRTAFQNIGKALTDPEHGLRALKAAGLALSEEQVNLVKRLLETGETARAQRIVLDELAKSVGGAAAGENTGVYGSSKAAAKAYDDFLKALGRTGPVKSTTESFFNFLTQSLRDMQEIIENGNWVEKFLAVAAFAGGMRGFKLTPQNEGGGAVSGKIRNGQLSPSDFGGMSEMDYRLQQLQQQLAYFKSHPRGSGTDAEQQRINKLLEEGQKGWVAYAQAVFDAADAENTALGAGDSMMEQLEKKQKAIIALIDPLVKYREQLLDVDELEQMGYLTAEQAAEARSKLYDMSAEALDGSADQYKKVQKETEKTDDVARQLGLTFTSAFEDAIVKGEALSDVLKGLEQDLIRLAIRKMVTEPMADAASKTISGMNWGGIFDGSIFSSAAPIATAAGGHRAGGKPLLVGENGPELFVPDSWGRVIPNNDLRQGDSADARPMVVNVNISTPDAGSFRQSRGQIATDVQMMLGRARRNM